MQSKKTFRGLSVVLAVFALIAFMAGTRAAAQSEKVLHSFVQNGEDGASPRASLVSDGAGNLYGTTYEGGAHNYGSVFELSPKAGGGWTETVLHSFNDNNIDGYNPAASLTLDSFGNLYGTTENGGSYLYGTAFELTPTKGGSWTEKVLHNFGSDTDTDGSFPEAALTMDKSGNLYGTTPAGGAYGNGVVFELTPGEGGTWTETTLHSFSGGVTDGSFPLCWLLRDGSGNLYGTTYQGGTYGVGTVFKVAPGAGGNWTETVVYSFNDDNDSKDANAPYAGLISDGSGNLYGTSYSGGLHNAGAVFELMAGAGGSWLETVLHSFGDSSTDGYSPMGGLIFDASGNLYGTTYDGGAYGYGAAFELAHNANGSWTEKTLHSFNDNGKDGYNPYAGLIFGLDGDLYGTTGSGGSYSEGTVFGVKP